VLMLCRYVYNAAIAERREAWQKCGVTVTYYQQKAELPSIKEAMPEYGEVNAQVLQDVVLRVDRAFQAFFRRIREGQTPGYPRFHGRNRYYTASPIHRWGNMAAHASIMAFWSSPGLVASPCAGCVR
jgi:transposase